MCLAREKRSEYIDEIREGTGASEADYESYILHTFLGMLIHICKMTHVIQTLSHILNEFGIREG